MKKKIIIISILIVLILLLNIMKFRMYPPRKRESALKYSILKYMKIHITLITIRPFMEHYQDSLLRPERYLIYASQASSSILYAICPPSVSNI